jgi:hypothetical protein
MAGVSQKTEVAFLALDGSVGRSVSGGASMLGNWQQRLGEEGDGAALHTWPASPASVAFLFPSSYFP